MRSLSQPVQTMQLNWLCHCTVTTLMDRWSHTCDAALVQCTSCSLCRMGSGIFSTKALLTEDVFCRCFCFLLLLMSSGQPFWQHVLQYCTLHRMSTLALCLWKPWHQAGLSLLVTVEVQQRACSMESQASCASHLLMLLPMPCKCCW